eukprot:TRINITY_DN10068_c0_g1_i1.p1 TRINITY_DN10068_c0_g1~~TRINITY_DN10068_c0_g1_i1.p1  ORF type:complete len:169 (+),score=30.03 TRINITY_DN10068_c0_g1_i1:42-548(+)
MTVSATIAPDAEPADNMGLIIGLAGGVVCVLCVAGVVFLLAMRQRRQTGQNDDVPMKEANSVALAPTTRDSSPTVTVSQYGSCPRFNDETESAASSNQYARPSSRAAGSEVFADNVYLSPTVSRASGVQQEAGGTYSQMTMGNNDYVGGTVQSAMSDGDDTYGSLTLN